MVSWRALSNRRAAGPPRAPPNLTQPRIVQHPLLATLPYMILPAKPNEALFIQTNKQTRPSFYVALPSSSFLSFSSFSCVFLPFPAVHFLPFYVSFLQPSFPLFFLPYLFFFNLLLSMFSSSFYHIHCCHFFLTHSLTVSFLPLFRSVSFCHPTFLSPFLLFCFNPFPSLFPPFYLSSFLNAEVQN